MFAQSILAFVAHRVCRLLSVSCATQLKGTLMLFGCLLPRTASDGHPSWTFETMWRAKHAFSEGKICSVVDSIAKA